MAFGTTLGVAVDGWAQLKFGRCGLGGAAIKNERQSNWFVYLGEVLHKVHASC